MAKTYLNIRIEPELKSKVISKGLADGRDLTNYVTKVLTEAVNKKGK